MRKALAEDSNRDFFRCRLLVINSMQKYTEELCQFYSFVALKLFIFYFVYTVQYKHLSVKMNVTIIDKIVLI